ncbi:MULTISPECIES: glycosyltransferase [Rhodococcus]|jgi:glycosyltransferase involved in cell wall biosynthesis|uniref:glycosyltransferase n=1 Tax=Rhodococcus TaxID=1827 RepID=UPI00064C23B5|nr:MULTISPECIES: glycosyltransferase [Rhodococcus]MDJ0404788.1 glycosyltransferase [Rhodococcus erythropolis]OFV76483.1 glycogen synthase [Rhodococcus erythropolis]
MKILQIVTLFSPDAAYGGPIRVALNQSKALQDNGHDVTIVAGERGYAVPPTREQGIALKLFPARTVIPKIGYAGIGAPSMLVWLRKHIREFDVVHIHLARDLVTLPAAKLALAYGIPVFAQTHGMIDETDKLLARPLDAALTIPVLKRARTVFYLTEREHADLQSVVGDGRLNLVELNNGIPEAEDLESPPVDRCDPPEVLYLARLQARKRPQVFVEAAKELLDSGHTAHFSIVGPDEGEAEAVNRLIDRSGHSSVIRYEGPLPFDKSAARFRQAAVYVLPSVNEPFPMSVLEAMAAGLPVVVTDTCGLAPLIRDGRCGLVIDNATESLTAAISSLLKDPVVAAEMGARARKVARERLGMPAVRAVLETQYGL